MKHYHGTPIGGTRASADEFSEQRLLLIPWKRPEDLPRALHISRGFMLDNSAFSFWTTGETPDWMDYIKWCRTLVNNPRFDFAIVPDVIDGTEKDNDDLIKLWDKKAYWPIKIIGCPVWHLHESLDRLAKLVRRWDRVAIGSSGQWATPGVGAWWDRMYDAFDAICDEDGNPQAKIHGLRMLRGDIVSRFPFASCDSTNATQNGAKQGAQNGVDACWGRKTIARRIESVQSPATWVRVEDRQSVLF